MVRETLVLNDHKKFPSIYEYLGILERILKPLLKKVSDYLGSKRSVAHKKKDEQIGIILGSPGFTWTLFLICIFERKPRLKLLNTKHNFWRFGFLKKIVPSAWYSLSVYFWEYQGHSFFLWDMITATFGNISRFSW